MKRHGLLVVAMAAVLYDLAPGGSDGPEALPFAIHRLDMALLGVVLAIIGVLVQDRRRKKRRAFAAMMVRGIGLRLGLVALGNALLAAGQAFGSRDYWEYPLTSLGFHILGPARMMAEQSLTLSGLGLSCTAEVLNHLLEVGALGPVAVVYFFAATDALIFALLGMAGERGLPPFRVFQVVSRIGGATALISIPLAIYGGRIGYWGAEPFAWLFSVLALGLLITAARRRI